MNWISTRKIAVGVAVAVCLHALAAILFRHNHQYAALVSNVGQSLLQVFVFALMLLNSLRSRGQRRAFWALMGVGVVLWLVGQFDWIYYENLRHVEVPTPSIFDLIIFMHLVPMIGAASVQPHAEVKPADRRFRLGYLDLSMLLLFWLFVYGYALFPWQFIQDNTEVYGVRFNTLYAVENLILIGSFAVLWLRTKREWHEIYKHLFIAATLYMIASFIANIAMDENAYVSGSMFDVPLTLAIGWFAYAAAKAYESEPEAEAPLVDMQRQAYWHSLLASAGVLVMPLMAAWAAVHAQQSAPVQRFRLLFTVFAMMVMMALFFFKQMVLDRRLIALVAESRSAYADLQKLQGHMLQAEKLAAIGRLVAGAAHEINNPLTAIVGYSDLLASHEKLDPQQKGYVEKILQQARRTKSLVQNLLAFAKQTPLERRPVNVNAVVGHALQLHELDFAGKNVQVNCRLHSELPGVIGDENQLLQVFLHIMNNAVDAMLEHSGGGTLEVATDLAHGRVLWTCSDTGPGVPNPQHIFDPFFTTKPVGKGTGLGLSASYGIVRDHGGHISCENRPGGGATFVISLPTAPVQSGPEDTNPRSTSGH